MTDKLTERLLCMRQHGIEDGDAFDLMLAVEKVLALIEQHEQIEQHNESVSLNRISDLRTEPSSADYRAALTEALGVEA